MKPIPAKIRQQLSADPDYRPGFCLFHNRLHGPRTKTEWHHAFIFKGQQVNERWAIMQICEKIHKIAYRKQVKERMDWIIFNRATDQELKKYSKAKNLVAERERLNKKYGKRKKNLPEI